MRRTITIPDELDKRIVESAKKNIRPIGSEVSYIVQQYFKEHETDETPILYRDTAPDKN